MRRFVWNWGSLGLSSHSFGRTPLPQRFNYILSYFRDINLGGMFGAGAVQKWMCDVTENANVSWLCLVLHGWFNESPTYYYVFIWPRWCSERICSLHWTQVWRRAWAVVYGYGNMHCLQWQCFLMHRPGCGACRNVCSGYGDLLLNRCCSFAPWTQWAPTPVDPMDPMDQKL